jgi:branched-chain amino acid transport system ATP-binding protein
MRSISGVLQNEPGDDHASMASPSAMPAAEIMAMGIAMVPEGRQAVSVAECRREPADRATMAARPVATGTWKRSYELFPVLKERRNQPRHGAFGRSAADGGASAAR